MRNSGVALLRPRMGYLSKKDVCHIVKRDRHRTQLRRDGLPTSDTRCPSTVHVHAYNIILEEVPHDDKSVQEMIGMKWRVSAYWLQVFFFLLKFRFLQFQLHL